MSKNQLHAEAEYLIYTSWETKMPTGATVCGSLYLDYYPKNEDEAKEMLELAKKNSQLFHEKYPMKNTIYRYGYHLNNTIWWKN
jgi:hypothetical protein